MRLLFCLLALLVLGSRLDVRADVELKPSLDGDDTAAFESAIAGGGAIRLKSGTFRVTKTLVVELNKTGPVSFVGDGTARIDMRGEGPAILFVGTHAGTADPSTVASVVWEKERMPLVRGIEFTASHPNGDAIGAEGTMQLTLTELVIRDVRHGIHLRKRNRNIAINQVNIYNNRGVGIYYDQVNLHQSNITGSHISYNKLGGVVIAGGDVRNVHITGCDIEANMSESLGYRANVWVECVKGSGAEIAITGCTIQHTASVPDSANIVFMGGEEDFKAEAPRWGHLTIADNILTDAHHNIWLKNSRGVTITGNSFGEGHQEHLLIESSESVVVGANVFDRNPPYYTSKAKESRDVLLFRDCKDCVVQGVLLNGIAAKEGAIQLERCTGMNVQGCSILEHGEIGLSLRDCRDCWITGCMFRGNGDAGASAIKESGINEGNDLSNNRSGGIVEKAK
jgi:hypothetical protein